MSLPVSSPHGSAGASTARIMFTVIAACMPGLAVLTAFFGWGAFVNVLWLGACALVLEGLALRLRGRDVGFFLRDGSALLTALLLALALPPTAPWWLGLCGIAFAILVAKQLYGGLGYNPFNPAMAGYVVLLISFPVEMTAWLPPRGVAENVPGFPEALRMVFLPDGTVADAFAGATPLDAFRQERGARLVGEFWNASPLFGRWSGVGWEWANLAFLAGGLYLLYARIISWHIPAGMLGSLALLALLFHDGGSSESLGPPLFHLLGGATMLGAFFIATDPVSAATTPRGKLLYGILIGTVVFVIRGWGNYPDAVAFAVLLGNFAAPLIDWTSRPHPFGRTGR